VVAAVSVGVPEGQGDEAAREGQAAEVAPACWYLAGCRWPLGCDAEGKCIGHEVEVR